MSKTRRVCILSLILLTFWLGPVVPGLSLVEPALSANVTVVINEFMASNNSTVADPQGEYDDWIELYNFGSSTVDLSGMYLTDNLNIPDKWQFPDGTTIRSGFYLLIWADGDIDDSGLHADFKLDADGEEIGLFDTDANTPIDQIEYDKQTTDISYGRYPDASETWGFMASPTPAARNSNIYAGEAGDPEFSHNRGFYTVPFYLTIASEPSGASIYYTLDGSAPYDYEQQVATGTRYTGQIRISTTTCIRAVAIRTGWKPSSTITHSYIYLDDVIHQPSYPVGYPRSWGSETADYAMDPRVVTDPAYSGEIIDDLKSTPSVSLVVDIDDFFGSGGIYSNPLNSGIEWERPVSMEWIDPNSGDNFGVNAGIRIHGGPYGRSGNSKKALRLIFRNQYGPSVLEYPLFPDTDVKTFDTIALRSIWNYSWTGHSDPTARADYLRDAFARDTVKDMGNLNPHGRAVQVYINGLYWGMYIMTERPDEKYAADHLGGEPEDYDMLEAPSGTGASTTMEIISGGEQARQAWNSLFNTAGSLDLSTSDGYAEIQKLVDIPNMIDYMLMIYYTGSRDAPVFLGDSYTPRNFYVVREREPLGPFTFIPWDTEWSLEDPSRNRVNVVGVLNPHYLIDKLKVNSDFRILMADRIYRQFFNDGALTTGRTTRRYLDLADQIYGAIVGESARWGDNLRPSQPYTRNVEWIAEVNRLEDEYFATRTDTVLNQLRQAGLYPSIEAPEFSINGQSQNGGSVQSGASLTMINPSGVGRIYYTLDGSDPRLSASSSPNGGGNPVLINENASKFVLVPTAADSGIANTWYQNNFNASSWTRGAGGVGYEASSGYQNYIGIDVINQMYGINGTCYIRIPFTGEGGGFDRLVLKIRYDDGFIAYLNGVEVARRNFEGTPTWNSIASGLHEDSAAVEFEYIDISDYVDILTGDNNLLAVQGLNQSLTSSDFLISVELTTGTGISGEISPEAIEYTGPIVLTETTQVKARVNDGSTWSAMHEAVFEAN